MATGANVKIGVSGVSQFKQNMNQAKSAVKTLDAQLALTEKQFKASGDAEEYMTKKSEELKAKLEAQKSVVENAEKALDQMTKNGVDRSSKAYQDLYREMLKAKGEMLDTENALNGVAEAGESAGDGVSEMNAQLKRIGDGVSWENVTDGLGKITSGMTTVIKKAWQVGEAIVNATLGAGAWADELQTTADQYEITPEQLYNLRQVADFIDTDVDTILSAQDKLKKGRESGNKEAMGALAYLGIDPTGKSDLDIFWQAGEAIAKLGKEEDKVAYAQSLFGKSWRELLPLFKAGREEYDEMYKSASWVGDENFQSLTALDDASQSLNNEWETLQKTFLGTLAGPMKDVMEILTGVLQQFNEYLQSDEGKEALKQMGDTITGLIDDLLTIDPKEVAKGISSVIENITNAFKWINDNHETVKIALGVIAGGFALIKVAELAMNIGKIVNGFQTLWSGAGKPLPSLLGGNNGGGGTTPTPKTTGGSGAATGAATGGAAKAGGKALLNGLNLAYVGELGSQALAGAGTAGYMGLGTVLHIAWVDEFKRIKEAFEQGAIALEQTAEKKQQYGDNEYFNIWDTLTDYLTVSGTPATDKEKMDKFAEHYMAWFNDEIEDPMLDKLTNLMSNEDFDAFDESMRKYLNGEQFYTEDDLHEFTDPLQTMLDLVESEMENNTARENANKDMTDAANEMPNKTAAAVKEALNGAQVVINGEQLTAVVGELLAGVIARYTV